MILEWNDGPSFGMIFYIHIISMDTSRIFLQILLSTVSFVVVDYPLWLPPS